MVCVKYLFTAIRDVGREIGLGLGVDGKSSSTEAMTGFGSTLYPQHLDHIEGLQKHSMNK